MDDVIDWNFSRQTKYRATGWTRNERIDSERCNAARVAPGEKTTTGHAAPPGTCSFHHRRPRHSRRRKPLDLVPRAARTPAGAGRGGCDPVRHRGAGRWEGRRDPGRTRAERRGRRSAGKIDNPETIA